MLSQVRYCYGAHLLQVPYINYGTGAVPYCTVHRPLSCLYSTSTCTTVLHSYRTLLQTLFSVLVEVQYNSVPYVFSHKYGTVVHIYYTTVPVPYRSVRYSGPSLACTVQYSYLLVRLVLRVRDCTVLYCTVLVPYFISNNILRAGTSTGTSSYSTVR